MIYDGKIKIYVTCAGGLEKALKSEFKRLGYGDIPAENGAFTVVGNIYDVCRLNVNLRTADRVYIELKEFPATDFNELFDGVYSLPFESFIPKDAKITVDGRCVKSKIFAVSASQGVVKKAIVKRLCEKYGLNHLSESGEEYKIEFRIHKDVCKLLLNTSGAGLHKRGYRDKVWIAPIKETLAAGLILYSDYYYKRPFSDPFCGSGTIAIETAFIAKNIAPGINRKFDFNFWQSFDEKIYKSVKEEAKDKEKMDNPVSIYASDIDKRAIELARRHALNAGVADYINFSVKAVKDVKLFEPTGTVVSNPPYGERVIDSKTARECYSELGKVLPESWSAFIITSDGLFERYYGKKADRKRKLYNSEKECNLYYYYGEKENYNG